MFKDSSFDRRHFLKATTAFGFLYSTVEFAAGQSSGKPNELLVGIASSANPRRTAKRALPTGAKIVGVNETLGYVRAELPERSSATVSTAATVASRSGVEYAEPNATYHTLAIPNDTRFDDQYAPQMVNAPKAWDTTFGAGDVTIAVVDQGIKYDHPDLEANVASDRGRDFVDNDGDPYPNSLPDEHHGTHVAGIAAAGTNNGIGVAGISNATLLSVRALDESGEGYTSDIADGIQWAADNGADVINLSVGGGSTETVQKAVTYANDNGVLLVAAAGNDYGGSVSYPAAYEECIAVSALDSDGGLADYSNTGPEVELCAPGTDLLSTWPDDDYETLSGTSMATPVVSGVAALVLSQQDLSNAELRERLTSTAVDTGLSSNKQGSGRVNAATAISGSLPNTLAIAANGSYTSYTATVSGEVVAKAGIGGIDEIDGSTAKGAVGGSGRDVYSFSGAITDLDLNGNATVSINDDQIDTSFGHTLMVEAVGSYSSYEFSVTGRIGARQGLGGIDAISGSSASGAVGGDGHDVYGFSGEITNLDVDGNANVYVDGESVATNTELLTLKSGGDRFWYQFSTSDGLRKSSAMDASIDDSDTISGRTATGHGGGGGADSYEFSGEVTDLRLAGDATLYLNGDEVSPTKFLPRTLTVEASGSYSSYEFSTSSGLAAKQGIGGKDTVHIEDGRATGAVSGNGRDTYAFAGEVTGLGVDGDAVVYIDGQPQDTGLGHTLAVEASGPYSSYDFSVTGRIGARQGLGGVDTISGSSASGAVSGSGRDVYGFSGAITDLDMDGNADVTLDGEPVDTDLGHTLTVEASGSYSSYEFSVTGRIGARQGLGGIDAISGSSASGAVGGDGHDVYGFSGEITNLDVDGNATVYLDGEAIGNTVSPAIGIYNGLSDADFDATDRMEQWQKPPFAVQNLFVPWNPDTSHMNWLFDKILPRIWNAGRVPLITWEPYTPGARTTSVDTQSLVEHDQYDAYIESLAGTTPNDIEIRIANGEYDGYIDRWAIRLRKALGESPNQRAYLRLAHEMNGDWYPWSPTVGGSSPRSYVEMWRRVHNRFDRQSIGDDLQWMWCVNAEDVGDYTAERLYPGDGYVDWVSLDGYNWGRSQSWSRWKSPDSIYGGMLDRLDKLADKPVCVSEFATSSKTSGGYSPRRKDEWVRNALTYFEDRGIDMWCWFNEDKETDWAVFDGVRGTETVGYNGERINAYSVYRTTVDSYATTTDTASESRASELAVGDD